MRQLARTILVALALFLMAAAITPLDLLRWARFPIPEVHLTEDRITQVILLFYAMITIWAFLGYRSAEGRIQRGIFALIAADTALAIASQLLVWIRPWWAGPLRPVQTALGYLCAALVISVLLVHLQSRRRETVRDRR